jgi:hypothetical protein
MTKAKQSPLFGDGDDKKAFFSAAGVKKIKENQTMTIFRKHS